MAAGVVTVLVIVSVLPASHAIQPGRLTTTRTDRRWWAATVPRGRITGSPTTLTGTGRLWGPVTTLTLCTEPPPSGIPILASPLGSDVRLALAETNTIATAARAHTSATTMPAAAQRPRCRLDDAPAPPPPARARVFRPRTGVCR